MRGVIPMSPRRRVIQERDASILFAAEEILRESGYYGLTMDAVASKSKVPKGTVYLRFGCKEDVVLALAERAVGQRTQMIRRGASFKGRARERGLAVGEATGIFHRLYPDQSNILHMAIGPLREKAAPERVAALVRVETAATDILREIVKDAVEAGDLVVDRHEMVEEILLGTWALVDGSHTLIQSGAALGTLGVRSPFHKVWRFFNVLADGYNWRPLFSEWDYEETMCRIRKTVFPEEAQRVYGPGAWYGDGM